MRFGLGYDIHRLVPTVEKSTIPIGGIPVSCLYRLEAHSDGDVLLHALVDGMLGALALGDIGQWFPDNAPENVKRPSHEFVAKVQEHILKMGYRVSCFDSILFLEEPKISTVRDAIRQNLARLLNLELSCVSVKAKTMEGMGAIGERKALAAQVIVTLEKI